MLNLEVKNVPKNGNLDLRVFIKTEMENFDKGIWIYLSV